MRKECVLCITQRSEVIAQKYVQHLPLPIPSTITFLQLSSLTPHINASNKKKQKTDQPNQNTPGILHTCLSTNYKKEIF